jgi:hypothetical protein
MAERIDPFFLVLVDDERHLFSVIGPMTDDTNWTNVFATRRTGAAMSAATHRVRPRPANR